MKNIPKENSYRDMMDTNIKINQEILQNYTKIYLEKYENSKYVKKKTNERELSLTF